MRYTLNYGRLLLAIRLPHGDIVEDTIRATNGDNFYPQPFYCGLPIVEAHNKPEDRPEIGIVWDEVSGAWF